MIAEEEKHRGYNIYISQDEMAENPRDFHVGTILSMDGANEVTNDILNDVRDKINHNMPAMKAIKSHYPDVVWVHKLYRYSHGSDTYALHRNFPDARWDLSWIGYYFVTRKDIHNWYSRKSMSDKLRERIYGDVAHMLEEYTNWCNGWIYGFMIKEIENVDLDGIFYGGYNTPQEALDEAIAQIDYTLDEDS